MEPGQARQFGLLYLEQSRDIRSLLLSEADAQSSTQMPWGIGGFQYPFVMELSMGYQQGGISARQGRPCYLSSENPPACSPEPWWGEEMPTPPRTDSSNLAGGTFHAKIVSITQNCPEHLLEEVLLPVWHTSSSGCAEGVVGWEPRGWQIILWRFWGSWSTCRALQDLQKAAIYNSKPTVQFKYQWN